MAGRFNDIADEGLGVMAPVENICCKGCMFVSKDNPFSNEPHKGYCDVYSRESGKMKPDSILFEGKMCKYRREP